jgi:hypothetical protein
MRAKKKEDTKRREEDNAGGATFKPRMVAKRSSSGYGQGQRTVGKDMKAHERLYKNAASKVRRQGKKQEGVEVQGQRTGGGGG